jgi:hypothetical protein
MKCRQDHGHTCFIEVIAFFMKKECREVLVEYLLEIGKGKKGGRLERKGIEFKEVREREKRIEEEIW